MNVIDIAQDVIFKITTSINFIIQNEYFLDDGIQFTNVIFAIFSFDIIYIYLKLGHLTTFCKFLIKFLCLSQYITAKVNIKYLMYILFSKMMIIKNWIIIQSAVTREHIGFLFKVFIPFKIFILFKHINNISSIFFLSFYYLKNK